MKKIRFEKMFYVVMVSLFVISLATSAFGQGKSGGAGRGSGGGRSNAGGPPAGVGVDRGLGNASERSGGRSDDGLGNASDRSNGRSDAGLDRARLAAQLPIAHVRGQRIIVVKLTGTYESTPVSQTRFT